MKIATIIIFFISICTKITGQISSTIKVNQVVTTSVNNGFWLENIITPQFQTGTNLNGIGFRDCFNPRRKQPFDLKFTSPVKISDYVLTLGVICRQELKLDKITPMPVRFRLGSLEYVNWMEQKPNTRRLN